MFQLADLTARYVEGPKLLREAVKGMSRDQLLARPIPGKWSTLEVVCHIADFEPLIVDRMKRILAGDKPMLWSADENAFAQTLAYADRDLDEELNVIRAVRTSFARVLRTKDDSILTREGNHNLRGLLTFEKVLQMGVNHIPHHIVFIHEKRKALGV
jgi:uncharacterized damage-inducible protein DinB